MAPTRRRKRLPRLDQRVLRDSDALGAAQDELLEAEPRMRRHRRRIIRLQHRLQAIVSTEAWSVYLDLDVALAARLNDAVDLATAWAFHEGRRRRRR